MIRQIPESLDPGWAVGCLVYVLDRLISVRVASPRAAGDLTSAQAEVALLLLDAGRLTCAELSRALHHDGGAMSRLVAVLEARGLARRERSASDRRAWEIELTEPGRDVAGRCREDALERWDRLLGGWDERDLDELTGGLERLARMVGGDGAFRRGGRAAGLKRRACPG